MEEQPTYKYKCVCGYETLTVGSAIAHINEKGGSHRLARCEA